MKGYNTIADLSQNEFVEKKSRFIGAATSVASPEEAMAFLAERRSSHPEARHTVWAYLLKDQSARYSDDGEPQGTGGQPVLEVLKRSGLVDVCVTVTRYFGGILLGAGGLTRAYANGAVVALKDARVVEISVCTAFSLEVSYTQYATAQRILTKHHAVVNDSDFTDRVTLKCLIRRDDLPALERAVIEATSATALLRNDGEVYSAMPSKA